LVKSQATRTKNASFDLEPHPEIPEGINVSKTHPLAEFGYLIAGVVGIVLVVLVLAQFLAVFLVRYIPFEMEKQLLEELAPQSFFQVDDDTDTAKSDYLQSLADRLSPHMDLPKGMNVKVHYDASAIPNAYATLGGNIVIYQGLIDEVSSENGLAMVLAHEIAHIKHRDPIMSLGRGVVTVIALAIVSGVADSGIIGNIVNFTGTGLLSKFSRDQESEADEAAVKAMLQTYGHLNGADEFFINMMKQEPEMGMVFFNTHPGTEERVKRIEIANAADMNTALVPLSLVLSVSPESDKSGAVDVIEAE